MAGFARSDARSSVERPISKTQLEAFARCQRKWAWSYLEGLSGYNKFADLGVRVHNVLADFLTTGVRPDPASEEGKIVEPGLPLLNPQADGQLVETYLFTLNKTAIYHGFADLMESPRPGLPFTARDVPVVTDHKTTVDFVWALTPDDLHDDFQANIYARAAMQQFETKEAVANWSYYRTRGAARIHPVQTLMTWDRVEETFGTRIDPLAEQIHAVYDERPKPLELEPNYEACSDYGGCSFRDRCEITAKGRLVAMVAKESLLSKMKARAAANASKSPAKDDKKTTTKAAPKGINPPEGKGKAPKAQPDAEQDAKKELASAKAKLEALKAKAKKKPEPEPEPEETTEEETATEQEAPEDVAIQGGFVLLYGCIPLRGIEFLDASEYIAPLKAEVAETFEVPDYRLVDFAKGPAALDALLREKLKSEPPTGFVFLDAKHDEGRNTYEAFRDHAGAIIRNL